MKTDELIEQTKTVEQTPPAPRKQQRIAELETVRAFLGFFNSVVLGLILWGLIMLLAWFLLFR